MSQVMASAPATGVPRLWPNSTIVCIAAGPSLTREDVEYCRGRARVLVINKSLLLAPWADVFHAGDARIGNWLPNEVRAFKGLKFSMERDIENDYGATLLKNGGVWGLSSDPEVICNGRNSGYQAIGVAVLLGAKKIVLLGYDMQPGANAESHWHGDHPDNLNPGELIYPTWRAAFGSLLKPLAALNVEVVNCTRRTALTAFPRLALEETL